MTSTKIGYVLLSNTRNPLPSTRVSVLNMFPYLRAANFEPYVLFEPQHGEEKPDVSGLAKRMLSQGVEIAYFQKVHGASVLAEIRKLSASGVKIIYGVCDLVENEMAEVADATIVVTEYLKSLYEYRLQHKIHVVHDGIENPQIRKSAYSTDRGSAGRPLRAVLVTSSELDNIPIIERPPSFLEVTIVGRYPRVSSVRQRAKQAYWKIAAKKSLPEKCVLASNMIFRKFKAVNWDIDTAYRLMAEADIGIIPVDMGVDPIPRHDVSYWQVKSENRLTMKMSVGLPVVASPVPSYLEILNQGKNGYLASNRDEWIQCMEELRDPDRRRVIGENARSSVIERYSKETQAERLIEILRKV